MTLPPTPPSSTLESLLEHGGWVRALARSLVADESTALDLEQKTWLAAIEKPPKHLSNPRAWLGSVVRNLAGMQWREQKARDRREDLAREHRWHKEKTDQKHQHPDGIAERVDTFRVLAHALADLEEPFATTLYLRFFEELPLRQIAERMQVHESTTKKRITRGLELLRGRLQSSIGKDWKASCIAVASPMAVSKAVTAGATVIAGVKLSKLIAAALLLGVSATIYFVTDANQAPATGNPHKTALLATSAKETGLTPLPQPAPLSRAPWNDASGLGAPSVSPPNEKLEAQVLDHEGKPLIGVPVALVAQSSSRSIEELQRGFTDKDGLVELWDPSQTAFSSKRFLVGFPFYSKGASAPIPFTKADWPTSRLVLHLAEHGQVKVLLRGPDGGDWHRETSVYLQPQNKDGAENRSALQVSLERLGTKTVGGVALLPFVGLHDDLVVYPNYSRWAQWESKPFRGPTLPRETVSTSLTAHELRPVMKVLLKDELGEPISATTLEAQIFTRQATSSSHNTSTGQWKSFPIGPNGDFEYPIDRGWGGEFMDLRLRVLGGQATPYLYTSIPVPLPLPLPWDPQEKRFDVDLGAQVMHAKRMVASGRFHDGAGQGITPSVNLDHIVVEKYEGFEKTSYRSLPGSETLVDKDGFFRCYGVTDSEQIHLEISPQGFLSQSRKVKTGAEDIDFSFQPDLGIYGQLIVPEGYALQDFELWFFDEGEDLSAYYSDYPRSGIPDASGHFRVGNIETRAPGTIAVIYLPSKSVVARFENVTPVSQGHDRDPRLQSINLDGLMTADIEVRTWNGGWLNGSVQYTILDEIVVVEPRMLYEWDSQFKISAIAPSLHIRLEHKDHRSQEFTIYPGPNFLQLEKAWGVTLIVTSLPQLPDGLQYAIRLGEDEEDGSFDFVDWFPKGFREGRHRIPLNTPGKHLVRIGVQNEEGSRTAWSSEWHFPFSFSGESLGASVNVSLAPEIADALVQKVLAPLPEHYHK